eukprot:1303120-Pleurochrysis_carterae.AAC.1
MELTAEHVRWIHITALMELLATSFNAITFAPLLSPHARTILMSDALATPYTLARKKARSDALQHALRCLLA